MGVEVSRSDSNMIFFDPRPCGIESAAVVNGLSERGVRMSLIGDQVRAVTHLDVDDADIEEAIEACKEILG